MGGSVRDKWGSVPDQVGECHQVGVCGVRSAKACGLCMLVAVGRGCLGTSASRINPRSAVFSPCACGIRG